MQIRTQIDVHNKTEFNKMNEIVEIFIYFFNVEVFNSESKIINKIKADFMQNNILNIYYIFSHKEIYLYIQLYNINFQECLYHNNLYKYFQAIKIYLFCYY